MRVWGQFDVGGEGKLPQSQLLPLLRFPNQTNKAKFILSLSRRIPPPLGLGALCPTRFASRHLLSLNIPIQVICRPFYDKQPNCGDRTISVFIFIGGWIC